MPCMLYNDNRGEGRSMVYNAIMTLLYLQEAGDLWPLWRVSTMDCTTSLISIEQLL